MTKREFMMQYVLAQASSDWGEPLNPADSARDAELAYIHIDKAAPHEPPRFGPQKGFQHPGDGD